MNNNHTILRERPKRRSLIKWVSTGLQKYSDLLKAYTVFIGITGIGFGLVLADWSHGRILDPMNNLTAAMSGVIINLCGGTANVHNNSLSSFSSTVSIAEGCNSVYVTIIFVAAVAAFPTSWRKKLLGIVLGTLALFAINLLRVISLLYLSGRDASLFEEAHLHIWQFAIILIGGLLWLLWYDKVVRRPHVPTL